MSAFAFFGGMAEEYSEIEATRVKAAAKAEKEDKEAQTELVEKTNIIFDQNKNPIIAFETRKGGQNQKEIIANQYALSSEIANRLEELKKNINKNSLIGEDVPDAVDGYITVKDKNGKTIKQPTGVRFLYEELTTNPFYVNQFRSLTSSAQADILSQEKRGEDSYYYRDYSQFFPHVNYFPSIESQIASITGSGYTHDDSDEAVWSKTMSKKYGPTWESKTANNGGFTKNEENLKEALGIYGSLVKSNFEDNEQLEKSARRLIELGIFDAPDAWIAGVAEYHPRRKVLKGPDAPSPGTIDSVKIDQTDSAESKKAPLVRETAFNIAKLTTDLQTYLLKMSPDGTLETAPAGDLPLGIVNFYDQIFAPGGAMDYMPGTIKKLVEGIKGDPEFIPGIRFRGKSLTFNEFLNEELDYQNEKGENKKLSVSRALEIATSNKQGSIWEDEIGSAGLFLSTEISLAFSIAIARQDFEGGKAVSDPDFERSLGEIRANGGLFGNAKAIAKKYSALRHEFAQKSFRYGITDYLKTNNITHASKIVSDNLSRILNTANYLPYEDGDRTLSPIVGRGLFLKFMLKDDRTLFRRIQELEGNPDLTKAEKDKLIEDIKNEIPEEEKPENITFSNTPGSN